MLFLNNRWHERGRRMRASKGRVFSGHPTEGKYQTGQLATRPNLRASSCDVNKGKIAPARRHRVEEFVNARVQDL